MSLARLYFISLCLILVSAFMPARAAESYDSCAGYVDAIPASITTPGTWCLRHDLITPITRGSAITINASNVTIDCNDFKLEGQAGAATQAAGIASGNRSNITIRNCNVRGFSTGASLSGNGSGHLIEDNRFDGETYRAIYITGDGSIVQRNQVTNIGGSTIQASAVAIVAYYSVNLLDNTIMGVTATAGANGSAYGIQLASSPYSRIARNSISGLYRTGTGGVRAVDIRSAGYVVLRENELVGNGEAGTFGLRCDSGTATTIGNVISHFSTANLGCNDNVGNIVNP